LKLQSFELVNTLIVGIRLHNFPEGMAVYLSR
jgi:zinc transporter ZupT